MPPRTADVRSLPESSRETANDYANEPTVEGASVPLGREQHTKAPLNRDAKHKLGPSIQVPEERDRQMAFETPLLPEAPHVDSPLPTLASGSAALIERLPPGPESRNSMVRVELQPGRAAIAGFFRKLVRRRGAANFTPPVPVTNTVPEL